MRALTLIIIFVAILGFGVFSQAKLPIEIRVDKQSMSTPMSSLEEAFFMNSYYTKPVTIKFDGNVLNMYYDNGATYARKILTEVNKKEEKEDDALITENYSYTDNNNPSDTILLVVDHNVGYIQFVLPTKNTKGEYIGYTSYKKFVQETELALK